MDDASFMASGSVETPLGETLWVRAPFIALINYAVARRKTGLKSTTWVFAMLEGLLHGEFVREPTHVALNSAYGSVAGVPMRFRADEGGVLQYVSNVDENMTFAYANVHFINPSCAADGTWSVFVEGLTTTDDGLVSRKLHAPVFAFARWCGAFSGNANFEARGPSLPILPNTSRWEAFDA